MSITDIKVPWNAMWTGEADQYEIRPCRYASGKRAIWHPHRPGVGRPIFARPHMVRQRRSIAEMRCTVCGEKTPPDDRWWFKLGRRQEGWLMTTEAPVHRVCADHALNVCPHLRGRGADLERMPGGYDILSSLVAGPAVATDYGLAISPEHPAVGALKIAWRLNAGAVAFPRA